MAKTRAATPATVDYLSRTVEDTQRLGEQLGRQLAGGDVIGLIGELGSGKTTFIQGVATGVGLDAQRVKSPTFVLLREYPGRIPLIHMDGYRLEGEEAMIWVDVEWVFAPQKITVIEWADRVRGCLPEDYLEIRFTHKTTNQRLLVATGHGPRSTQLLEALRGAIDARAGR